MKYAWHLDPFCFNTQVSTRTVQITFHMGCFNIEIQNLHIVCFGLLVNVCDHAYVSVLCLCSCVREMSVDNQSIGCNLVDRQCCQRTRFVLRTVTSDFPYFAVFF